MQFAKSVLLVLPALGHVHAELPSHFELKNGLSQVEEPVHVSDSSFPAPVEVPKTGNLESEDSFISKASGKVFKKTLPYAQDAIDVVKHCSSGSSVNCAKAVSQSSVAKDIASWLDGALPIKALLSHVQDGASAMDKCFYTGTSADCLKTISESELAKSIQKGLSQGIPQVSKARVYSTDMADIANKCLPLKDKAEKAALDSLESSVTNQQVKLRDLKKEIEASEGGTEHQERLREESEKLTKLEEELATKHASLLAAAQKSPFAQKLDCASAFAKSQMGQDAGHWIGETVPGVKTAHAQVGNVVQVIGSGGQSAMKVLEVGKNVLVDGSYIRQYCLVDKDGKKCLVAVLFSNTAIGGYKAVAKKLLGFEF